MTSKHTPNKVCLRLGRILKSELPEWHEYLKSHDALKKTEPEITRIVLNDLFGKIAREKFDADDIEGLCIFGMLDIDSLGKPRCRNRNPCVDTTNWTENTCKICRKVMEEVIELEKTLGRRVARKNIGALLLMGKRLAIAEDEATAKDESIQFYKKEVGLSNNEISNLTRKNKSIPSFESIIHKLREQNEMLRGSLDSKDAYITKLKNKLEEMEVYSPINFSEDP